MTELPSGTVTFLLTDVEGSTALWEEAPEATHVALARHDALFDEIVREHHGIHIRPRGEGDSRFAVFTSAPDAVATAIAVQRAFAAEAWPTPRPITVRIGLHTGEAEVRDGDYYGSTVNRCARLRGIGHGGQILLSEATAALVREGMSSGTRLLDLGLHRLKGLTQPERVSQLLAPDLPSDFPPLASLDARPHNLPTHPTSLLGREQELAEVRGLFHGGARLVTLTGPGGTGKTRLGLQVAADLLDDFKHGVFLVDLAPISDPTLVGSTIAQALGVRDVGNRPVVDALQEYLRARSVLLLLDNFEQILSAAPVVSDLLAACPDLKVLVTSREPLRVRGEQEYAVDPLALPDDRAVTPDAVLGSPAVALFAQRARAIRPDFAVTSLNAAVVAELCRRLDGLPLAIELAAARVRLLSPQLMVGMLERRLQLLAAGARDLPSRQRTLRDTIAWSHDHLDDRERRLFRRLAVFVGGWTIQAAEAVGDPDDGGLDVFAGLDSLASKSLVRQGTGADPEPRFAMLETIREYALERLEASGEAAEIRRRHARYWLEVAETAQVELIGRDQVAWLARLEADHDNLRTALAWSLAEAHGAEPALRLAGSLYRFWWRRCYLSEGREWLARALARDALPRGQARARALNGAGVLARIQADYRAAHASFEESLAIARELGDRAGIAQALQNLGSVARHQGQHSSATALFEQSLALWRELGDTWGIAVALWYQAHVAQDLGDYERATRLSEESLALARERGDTWLIAIALQMLGRLARAQRDDERAAALAEEVLAQFRELGDKRGIACALDDLGRVAHARGNDERARTTHEESLALFRDLGDTGGTAMSLEGLAGVAEAMGRTERGARLFGAAEALREAAGQALSPVEYAEHDREVAVARVTMGDEAFAAAWAEGRAMTLEQAVAYALDEQPPA
jgi:predicted ATPase/class 3 adenylate cyclase